MDASAAAMGAPPRMLNGDFGMMGMMSDEEKSRADMFAWLAFSFFCAIGPLAYFAERMWRARASRPADKPLTKPDIPVWSAVLLGCSYVLLLPGLLYTIFQYNVSAMGGLMELQHGSESMLQFIADLWNTGCWYGAAGVTLYAIVIPGLKLTLLVAAQVLRRDPTPEKLHVARVCVITLQAISKWASPDMFAYVLLMYLVRNLDHPPVLIGVGSLDAGFTCFSIFCVFSTIAALGIRAPEDPRAQEEDAAVSDRKARMRKVSPFILVLFFIGFVVLLGWGASVPCMALRLDMESLYAPVGPISEEMKPIVIAMQLPELVHAEVSLWKCIGMLANWGISGDANFFIAFALFAVFVIAFTVLDMVVLIAAAVSARRSELRLARECAPAVPDIKAIPLMEVSRVLKKLSMLDVAITGVVVVTLCGYVYRKSGVFLSIRWGLSVLAGAEACHHLAYGWMTYCAQGKPVTPVPHKEGVDRMASQESVATETSSSIA